MAISENGAGKVSDSVECEVGRNLPFTKGRVQPVQPTYKSLNGIGVRGIKGRGNALKVLLGGWPRSDR